MYYKSIILGSSTGGPSALRVILKQLPKDFPLPIIIVQRVPPGLFAESLAEALDDACELKVRILNDEDSINPSEAVLIPGGFNILFDNDKVKLIKGTDIENSPSISHTITQSLGYYEAPVVLSVLTGICLDDDLIQETKILKEKNGWVTVQNPETCFIGDLPQTLIKANVTDDIIALDKIGNALISLSQKN